MKVDFLPETEIEAEAEHLIKSYEAKHGKIHGYQIPVEEIAEGQLNYHFGFTDLESLFPDDTVHGMINFDTNEILIHQDIEPSENPKFIGKYNFTVAHECGHHILHKDQVIANLNQNDLFEGDEPNQILCRKEDARESIEWQADCFAAYLTMPKAKIYEMWKTVFGDYEPRTKRVFTNQFKAMTKMTMPQDDLVDIALKDLAREHLGVSPIALRIRLAKMGLLLEGKKEYAWL